MNPTRDTACAPSASTTTHAAALATHATTSWSPVPPDTLLGRTHDARRLDAWTLVLVSKGVRSFAFWTEAGFELHVAPERLAFARAELDAVDAEERETQRAKREEATRKQRPATRHALLGGVAMAAMLALFFAVTGPRAGHSAWFTAGASDAERVLHGEWWRAVTALTLHADGAHVASNIGIGALVIGAVMRTEGVGWGAALVLASGTLGNLLNAWAHQSLHVSVGFSTAVFGAIGLLGALAYARNSSVRGVSSARPAWTALAGSVALLAALGSGERSDVFAHLFGGLAGVGLGLLVGYAKWRPQTWLGQSLAGGSAAAVVVAAWLAALT